MPDPKTLEERASAIEQSAARLRRHWPLSRRQQLMLNVKRLAALRLRKEAARLRAAGTPSTAPASAVPGTDAPPSPCRAFRLISNPAAIAVTPQRTRARPALRIVQPGDDDSACA